MARMQVGTGEFNVVIDGADDAPAVLLSNSLGTNLHMWDDQAEALRTRFRVIRYDSRGHGGSVADEGPYSIEQLGRDALAILDALQVSKAHFVGLSMGGMVGMWLMTNAPERIGRAVLANTGAHMGSPDLWNTRIRTAKTDGMAPLTAATIDRWFTREFQESAPQAVERIAQMVRSTPAEGYAGCCAAIRDMDQRESIRGITNPVLVIVGKSDPATPPTMGGLIADHIKGARILALEAAHLSNIEASNAFNRALLSFLSVREADTAGAPAKAVPAKTAPAKAAARKKPAAKKAAVKKSAVKKTTAKKKTAKKAAAKKPVKKAAARKASKAAAKKIAKKPVRKSVVKAAKKAAKKFARKAAKTAAPKKSAKKAAKKPAGKKR
ncbi:3-oxoadipate enol-lactonase [Roseiarcaceae bacterium H3SJ34-1]|uniref:3-oxoadipate enol-lactonase n=1 Tax=Terripilifer ovatus TaxID=3032367 RepID=UPI003AB98B9C|nr:3-oxoadipate enol-lactonase [Roseiarcaceae bacterium H3SJ34-1]